LGLRPRLAVAGDKGHLAESMQWKFNAKAQRNEDARGKIHDTRIKKPALQTVIQETVRIFKKTLPLRIFAPLR
jgi:hypothetical protein